MFKGLIGSKEGSTRVAQQELSFKPAFGEEPVIKGLLACVDSVLSAVSGDVMVARMGSDAESFDPIETALIKVLSDTPSESQERRADIHILKLTIREWLSKETKFEVNEYPNFEERQNGMGRVFFRKPDLDLANTYFYVQTPKGSRVCIMLPSVSSPALHDELKRQHRLGARMVALV